MDRVTRYNRPTSDWTKTIAVLNPRNAAMVDDVAIFTIDHVAFMLVLNEKEMVLMAGSTFADPETNRVFGLVDDLLRGIASPELEAKTMKLGDMLGNLDLIGLPVSTDTILDFNEQEMETLRLFAETELTFKPDALPLQGFLVNGSHKYIVIAPRRGNLSAAKEHFLAQDRQLFVYAAPCD
jgi:hypothetical protein